MKEVFDAKSAVVLGSSKLKKKVGMCKPELFAAVSFNMQKFFHGKVYVVDVEKRGCEGVQAELAVVMLPPEDILPELKKLKANGLCAAIILTGGFSDSHISELKKMGIRFVGPNTIFGVINTKSGLNTTFEKDLMPKRGGIAIISQSGGVGAALLDLACKEKVGISKVVFMGQKKDISDVEVIEYLAKDKQTKVITLYLEGLSDGRAFVRAVKACKKPVVVLKGGRTEESEKRALSHTASISGKMEVFDAACRKAGAIQVDSMVELFDAARALKLLPRLKGDMIVVISNVGGPAILAADALASQGFSLAKISDDIKAKVEAEFPGVEMLNPIDLIADADAKRYRRVLELVLSDPCVDGALVIAQLKSTFLKPKETRVICDVKKSFDKAIVCCVPGGFDFDKVLNIISGDCVPVFDSPQRAVKALCALRPHK